MAPCHCRNKGSMHPSNPNPTSVLTIQAAITDSAKQPCTHKSQLLPCAAWRWTSAAAQDTTTCQVKASNTDKPDCTPTFTSAPDTKNRLDQLPAMPAGLASIQCTKPCLMIKPRALTPKREHNCKAKLQQQHHLSTTVATPFKSAQNAPQGNMLMLC